MQYSASELTLRQILHLAGADATDSYDPIHPPGTLEQLKPEARLGSVDSSTLIKATNTETSSGQPGSLPQVNALLNLEEIEAEATKRISKKAWAYYYSAGDDLISKKLNHEVYHSILLRPRIFVDCGKCSLQTSFLGCTMGTAIYVAPAAMARLAQ